MPKDDTEKHIECQRQRRTEAGWIKFKWPQGHIYGVYMGYTALKRCTALLCETGPCAHTENTRTVQLNMQCMTSGRSFHWSPADSKLLLWDQGREKEENQLRFSPAVLILTFSWTCKLPFLLWVFRILGVWEPQPMVLRAYSGLCLGISPGKTQGTIYGNWNPYSISLAHLCVFPLKIGCLWGLAFPKEIRHSIFFMVPGSLLIWLRHQSLLKTVSGHLLSFSLFFPVCCKEHFLKRSGSWRRWQSLWKKNHTEGSASWNEGSWFTPTKMSLAEPWWGDGDRKENLQ